MTSHNEIRKWLDLHGLARCRVNIHDEVECSVGISLPDFSGIPSPPPFKFSSVQGDFLCGRTPLESIDWLPTYVGNNFDCSATNIKSFAGLHERIQYIGGTFFGTHGNIPTHHLGLLLIPGIKRFSFANKTLDDIFNKYVGTGDILSAQDELIDAGFIDQARL
jgi:hypothetical protein